MSTSGNYAKYGGIGGGGGGGGGVTSLNSLTGGLTLAAGTGITITSSGGNTLTIGTTALATAITSINGDTTSAQLITASNPNLSVATTSGNTVLTLVGASLVETGSSVLTFTGATNAVLGTGVTIQVKQASGSQSGYLSSTDWTTFNNKQATITTGNLTDAGTDGITVTGGTGAVIGTGTSISQHVADTTHSGYLSSTDWNTFNGKQASGNYITALTGDATASGPGSVALTLATVNASPGSFGSASSSLSATVNAKGLITALSSQSIQIAESQVTNLTTDLAAKATNPMTTIGDVIYASNTATPATAARLGIGTANQVLGPLGSNTTPSYRTIYEAIYPNYIAANPNAEVDTTGWATYSNTAANIPSNGTGGTATGLTFSRSTSSPLRGTASFSMVQANSTSLQGKGVSYDFTIDSADQGAPLNIYFDYNASSTFVASNGITPPLNDGTTSTNAGNSDIEVFLYDKTNSVLIPVSPQVITANGANNFSFSGSWQSASNSTSYRLIFHVATANANATGWTFKFDNIYVGQQPSVQGAAVGNDTSTTLTVTGAGTITSQVSFVCRIGDKARFRGYFTAGTPTAVALTLNLPSGMSIDSTKMGSGTNESNVGVAYALSSSSNGIYQASGQAAVVFYDGSTTSGVFVGQATSSSGFTKINGSTFLTSSEPLAFEFTVPISGWGSNVEVSNSGATRVVAAKCYASTTGTANTTTPINYDTKIYDTHGAVTTGAGWTFTCPVSGFYQINTFINSTIASGSAVISVYKNGTALEAFGILNSTITESNVSTTIQLVSGDQIQIRSGGSSLPWYGGSYGAITAGTAPSVIEIERVSGPGTIAASETVSARYFASSTSISGSATAVVWTTKDYDDHNAMSSGTYTIPISGKYQINSALALSGTFALNSTSIIQIAKNGTAVSEHDDYAGGIITASDPSISDVINCLAGDLITIKVSCSASGPAIVSSNTRNYVSIVRVGN